MGENVKRRLAAAFDFPKDVLLDLPRIIVIGNMQVFIDNHRGVIEYSPEKVVIGCGKGQIAICGTELLVKCILPQSIEIAGHITSMAFEG